MEGKVPHKLKVKQDIHFEIEVGLYYLIKPHGRKCNLSKENKMQHKINSVLKRNCKNDYRVIMVKGLMYLELIKHQRGSHKEFQANWCRPINYHELNRYS